MFRSAPGKLSIFSFFLFISLCIHAQPGSYSLLKKDADYQQSVFKVIEGRYNSDIDQLKGENKKYFKEIYKERFNEIKMNFDSGAIITDPTAVAYINELAQKIISSNPVLQKFDPKILLYRAWWPNASSWGEGTVFVNIGIVYKFTNEAQLVFTICHELAHLYLDHVNNAIAKYINTVYSDEFQKELKKINRQQYEKNRQLDELAKSFVFKSRRHSREHEAQADSMALEFMKNSVFDVREARSALTMLDSIDSDKYNVEPPLARYFNDPAYPFQQSWLKEPETFFGGVKEGGPDKKIKDSLKTHPDCKQRVLNISPMVDRYYKAGTLQNINETAFKAWQQQFDYEVISYAYERGDISLALYYSLQTLDHYPGDGWLMATIGNCLNRMYIAQKKHELNKITSLPSPYNEKKYNHFLQFLQNLTLSDISAISYYFMEDNRKAGISNEDYIYALINSKDVFNKPAEKQELISYYKSNFTKPKYKF